MRFVDTNILLYAVSRDPAEPEQANRANEILAGRDVALSVQVLQEFYVQATRESRPDPLSHEQATRLIESFMRFPVQEKTTAVMLAAMTTRDRFDLIAPWITDDVQAPVRVNVTWVTPLGDEVASIW